MRTNTNRLIAGALLASMPLMSSVYATNIGTGTVVGSGALNTTINWNDTYTAGSASGSNILTVTAKIQPTLNMTISGSTVGVIDLGTLSAANYQTGSVDIEVGTNATNGASVTAKSGNGGLKNGADVINSLGTDGIPDSYKFSSALVAGSDSAFSGTAIASLNVEVVDNTTAHTLYTYARPQSLSANIDDFKFSVSAKPDAQSPAGSYSDTVTISVTGNF
ncbi:hypothetical protein HOO68_04025 [Candidatus Gracilibacteria bacterium]|nr:hypothetical protein [Candidatus Gracilibacteria bacterium]